MIWTSLIDGIGFSFRDFKEWGRLKLFFTWIGRMGQALLINLPYLILAYLKRGYAEILGRKCLLDRFIEYTRETLFLLAPSIFPQERFFARLEFRRERTSFGKSDTQGQ